jgi:hypothetical protein
MERREMLELVGRVRRGRCGRNRGGRWRRWSGLLVRLRWRGCSLGLLLLLLLVPMVRDRSSGDDRAAPGSSPESHLSPPFRCAPIISTRAPVGITQKG